MVTIGLDSSGKTTVLYRLKFDQYVNTVPTIGFNCEKVKGSTGRSKNLTFLIWDVGGQETLRPLWRPYTRATDAIIFVVDSSTVPPPFPLPSLRSREEDLASVRIIFTAATMILASAKSAKIIFAAAEMISALGRIIFAAAKMILPSAEIISAAAKMILADLADARIIVAAVKMILTDAKSSSRLRRLGKGKGGGTVEESTTKMMASVARV